jgi:hypothetical protein
MATSTKAGETITFAKRETERVHSQRYDLFPKTVCDRMTDDDHLAPDDVGANLFRDVQEPATRFFKDRNIAGHGGGYWDHSVTSSQVSCVNCLFPFVDRPALLKPVLNTIFGDVDEVLPITAESPLPDGSTPFLTFEWIDKGNRLGERGSAQRGRYVTNVDVLFRYRSTVGTSRLVLTEWKYRETCQPGSIRYSRKGTDRLATYKPHFGRAECRKSIGNKAAPADLMFEPFDQLMRLQLLASIMQRDNDMEADSTVVLHIAPNANSEFRSVVNSPRLAEIGGDVYDAWAQLVRPGCFFHFATEDLVPLLVDNAPSTEWGDYVRQRYGGMQ